MSNKTFAEIQQSVPLPKVLTLDERLPYVFDLHWDCKTLRQLYYQENNLTQMMLRELCQAGYDASKLPANPYKEKNDT